VAKPSIAASKTNGLGSAPPTRSAFENTYTELMCQCPSSASTGSGYGPARCPPHTSDHGGRTRPSFLECAAAALLNGGAPERHSVEVLTDWSSETSRCSRRLSCLAQLKRMEAEQQRPAPRSRTQIVKTHVCPCRRSRVENMNRVVVECVPSSWYAGEPAWTARPIEPSRVRHSRSRIGE
jgi:hypothetical protein